MNPIWHRLDLNLLRVFDALMQEGHLTRAAERLHLSQPAVSNALGRLREQLGAPLFVRNARGMTPTAQALALYGPVRAALRLLQDGLAPEAAFDPQLAEQRFHLSMNDYAQFALLPSLLARVRAQAPSARTMLLASRTRLGAEGISVLDLLRRAADLGATDVGLDHRLVEPSVVAAARAARLRLSVWTVNDEADLRRMGALGVDLVMTDRPDVARRVFGRH